jgi:hypothetical protein
LKTKFKAAGGAFMAHGHYFMSAAKVADSNGKKVSAGLGTEIDLVYTKELTKGVNWTVGYSQMFATDSMLAAKGMAVGTKTAGNNWAWVQLVFKPTLFKSAQ